MIRSDSIQNMRSLQDIALHHNFTIVTLVIMTAQVLFLGETQFNQCSGFVR